VRSSPSNGRRNLNDQRRRRAAAGAVAAAALCAGALTGCGGSSKAAGSGEGGGASTTLAPVSLPADLAQRPACDLVTQAEVEAAVGGKVTAGKGETQPARSVCGFTLVAAADQSVVIVSISSSGVPAAFEASRSQAVGSQPVTAGDQAFVTGTQGLVRKGNTMVAILVAVRQSAAQITAAATRLTQAVGARL
jgi:hypothetical protein